MQDANTRSSEDSQQVMRDEHNGYMSDEELAVLTSDIEGKGLYDAPAGLKSEIMWNADRIIARRAAYKKRSLLSYSIKIAVGTAAAVFLLAVIPVGGNSGMWTDQTRFEESIIRQNDKKNEMTEKISNEFKQHDLHFSFSNIRKER